MAFVGSISRSIARYLESIMKNYRMQMTQDLVSGSWWADHRYSKIRERRHRIIFRSSIELFGNCNFNRKRARILVDSMEGIIRRVLIRVELNLNLCRRKA